MAFVVEDGTGIVDANSYASIVFAKAYYKERGITTFEDLYDDDFKAALILATDYIEMRYSLQFNGTQVRPYNPNGVGELSFDTNGNPVLDTNGNQVILPYVPQALSFPRLDKSGNLIPMLGIQKATCEYALRTRTTSLIKDSESEGIVMQRVKIGQIEKETSFVANSKKPSLYSSFPSADLLIKPYLKPMGNGVIRA